MLFTTLVSFGQQNFVAIDTLSSECSNALGQEYQKKFESINKSISFKKAAEKNLIKEIYSEIQEDFLEKIKQKNFICNNDLEHYLKGLMDEVLTKNNINPQDYKILLSKDSEINAYNTGDGTIVINYGLFLTVENEDELVFVISHEIGHQFLSHVRNDIEAYVKLSRSESIIAKTKEIQRQKYGKATKANDLLKSIRYESYEKRRRKEIEADSIGIVFYGRTLRNPKAAINILEKFDSSDIERDSLTVADYKFIFEKNGFTVKQKYFNEEKSLFSKYDKLKGIDIDSLKSHPDCTTRIKLIEKKLEAKFSETYSNPTVFSEIKRNSTYQNLYNLYSSKKYGISLYESLKLYKKQTDDPVLQKIIHLNLLKIYESRINYTINRYVPAHDNLYNTASLNRFVSYLNNIKISDFETIINNFKS
ncbi:M48 family metallopeptidase [Flavobacterium sp. 28YEA47A]|uniref:M48 family metallopeptidase n=1 Tax=Flavobacterium sp. 28YEA47A TaxID=3156276 RepID=UPI003517ECFC